MTMDIALELETYVVVSSAHLRAATDHRFRIPLAPALTVAGTLPAELAALLGHMVALAPEAYGVMIDCDGPVLEGLATFDW
jgi:hypothetical protein